MSTITIAEASHQLPQLIEKTANGDKAIFLTANGQPKAVLLNIETFWHFLGVDIKAPLMPFEQFQQEFSAALREAGYDSEEKIVELVREVKREIAEERSARSIKRPVENGLNGYSS